MSFYGFMKPTVSAVVRYNACGHLHLHHNGAEGLGWESGQGQLEVSQEAAQCGQSGVNEPLPVGIASEEALWERHVKTDFDLSKIN